MNVVYSSPMFEEVDLKQLLYKNPSISYAANKYNRLLCEGIAANGVNVTGLVFLPINRTNCKMGMIPGKVIKNGTLTLRYLTTFHFPFIKNMFRFFSIFFYVLFARKKTVLIYDVLSFSSSAAITIAGKIRGLDRIAVITDLPEYLGGEKAKKRFEKIIGAATGYILLTKQMSEKVNPTGKPEIVLEGHSDASLLSVPLPVLDMNQPKTVFYAGALYEKYGVRHLTDSFLACQKDGEELHLYGDGEYVPTLKEVAKKNPTVHYDGIVPNSEIVEAEYRAYLLVNPRTSEGEFTKYSFPSKVIEYMSSGRPVLMARLPGIPEEYYSYVYTFDDKDPSGLEKALRRVLDLPAEELSETGRRAREFVLTQKNNAVQAKKIIDTFLL